MLNKIILRGLSNIFVLPVYIHDWGRILETSLNMMQLSNNNTKRTMTLMLKLIITRPILDFWARFWYQVVEKSIDIDVSANKHEHKFHS